MRRITHWRQRLICRLTRRLDHRHDHCHSRMEVGISFEAFRTQYESQQKVQSTSIVPP